MSVLQALGAAVVLLAGPEDVPLDVRRLKDLMAEGHAAGVAWLVVPVELMEPAFFDLRTGVAGEILQASVTYSMPLALVGPLPEPAASSNAFAALVRESNRGRDHWFVASLDELGTRLAARDVR